MQLIDSTKKILAAANDTLCSFLFFNDLQIMFLG